MADLCDILLHKRINYTRPTFASRSARLVYKKSNLR